MLESNMQRIPPSGPEGQGGYQPYDGTGPETTIGGVALYTASNPQYHGNGTLPYYENSTVTDVSAWYTMAFILFLFFFIFFTLNLRSLCRDCLLALCGHGGPLLPHSSQRPLGNWPQGQGGLTPEEIAEKQLDKQRQERKLWYSYYLKPFLTILTEENFKGGETKANQDTELEEEMTKPPKSKDEPERDLTESSHGEKCVLDAADMQTREEDPESAISDVGITSKTNKDSLRLGRLEAKDSAEEFPTKIMTVWDPHDTIFRCMEASCSICLLDYEPGDTIVRSATNEEEEVCIHVFHVECMLQWLSHGRKRCPICRHWFVPAVRIKDQMKQAHVITQDSMHHLYDERTLNDLVSLGGGTDSNMSHSSNTPEPDDTEQGGPIIEQAPSASPRAAPESSQLHVHHNHSQPTRRHRNPVVSALSDYMEDRSLRMGNVWARAFQPGPRNPTHPSTNRVGNVPVQPDTNSIGTNHAVELPNPGVLPSETYQV